MKTCSYCTFKQYKTEAKTRCHSIHTEPGLGGIIIKESSNEDSNEKHHLKKIAWIHKIANKCKCSLWTRLNKR